MTGQLTTVDFSKIESVLIAGDLAKLTSEERVSYNQRVCESLGMNALTRPFEFMVLNGKLVMYAKRDATDQLRRIHSVSVTITSRERVGDVYIVTARAQLPNGRTDESTGAVSLGKLQGEALANAYMKCETKAKRRVTLSICGLGLLDETEVEAAPRDVQEPVPKDVQAAPRDVTPGSAHPRVEPHLDMPTPMPSPEGPYDHRKLGPLREQVMAESRAKQISTALVRRYLEVVLGVRPGAMASVAQLEDVLKLLKDETTDAELFRHLIDGCGEDHAAPDPDDLDRALGQKPPEPLEPNIKRVNVSDIARAEHFSPDGQPYLPMERVDEVRAYGRGLGYTDEEMTAVLERRLHHNRWDRLVAFNLTVLRNAFNAGDGKEKTK